MNNRYFVPQNINRGYTIGPFRLSGIFEGIILGFLGYKIVGLFPIEYSAVKIVFQLILAAGLFIIAARGFTSYSISEYVKIIIKYFINRSDREFRKAFRLEKANSKTTEEFAQGMVIEKDFGDGVIKLKDGRYVSIVVVSPVNFFTKTVDERNYIVQAFAMKLRSMPVKGQIVSYTMSANPYEYIDFIRSYENLPKNKGLKKEYEDYYALCRSGIGYGTVNQKFYVVFSSDALDQIYKTEQERLNALRQCAQDFARFMNQYSMNDNSEKTVSAAQFRRDNSKLLFEVYNPVLASLKSKAYDERADKVEKTFHIYDRSVTREEIPLSYFLAPMGFDDSASPRYIVAGDTYYSFYYIAQNTYPISGVTPGWIAQQLQMQGIDYHLFYQEITDSAYIGKLNTVANLSRKLVNAQERESQLKTEITSVYEAASYLKNCIENNDRPYYMGIMISLHANRISRLYALEDNLIRRMMEQSIRIVPCRFLQKEAYLATRLGNQVPQVLWKKMRQNVPSSTLAAMFPFASTSISDTDGVYLGNSNGSPVFLNTFDTSHHDNGNAAIMGSSGKGKTFTIMLMALRNRLIGREIFIIAPIKGTEFDGFTKALGGNMIRINSTSGNTINIMEIYPHLKDEYQDSSLLYKKVESIKAFVMFKKPDMSAVEQQILDKCTIETYKRFGITQENDSLWVDKEKGIKKKMPILGDLVKTVDEYAAHDKTASDLATVMHVYTEGSLTFFNAPTNIDLSKGVTVFDLSGLSASTKTLAMFVTTELIQSYMEEDRSVFKMLIVDEIWLLLENESSAEVVVEWAKTIRGRGGSLVIATQELADLSRTKRGATMVTQSETRILLGMRIEDLNYTDQMLALPEPLKRLVLDAKRGNGVLMTRDASVGISVMGSGHNILTFTTDPNLTAIRETLQNEDECRYVEGLLESGKKASEIRASLEKYRAARKAEPEYGDLPTPGKPPKRPAKEKPTDIKPPKRKNPDIIKPPRRGQTN